MNVINKIKNRHFKKIIEDYDHLIYIKSGKTAGSSIVQAFLDSGIKVRYLKSIDKYRPGKDLLCVQSDLVFYARKQFNDIWESAYKFAVVRNPYDRVVSGYLYHPEAKDKKLIDLLQNPIIPEPLPYYTKWKEEQPKDKQWQYSLYNHLYAVQSEYLFVDDKPQYNKILKFENLKHDFEALCAALSVDICGLPHVNINKERKNYEKYLNADSYKLINDRFKEDFIRFDYKIC